MVFIKYFERAKLQNQISFFENKLFVTLLLVVVLGCAFSLSACSSNEDASAIDPEEEYTEEDTEVDAGMEELLTSYFPYDKEYWYLVRGNNTYTLNASRYDDEGSSYLLYLDLTYCDTRVAQTGIEGAPVVLQKGDTVISTFPREAPTLKLFKANFHGWGFPVIYYEEGHELNFNGGIENDIAYDLRIEDEAGNTYEDPFNLEKDGTYKFSWNDLREGYQYYEVYASGRNYELEDPNKCYEVEGVKTESGRAEYDLSDIPPGIYRIGEGQSGGFIEIK